MRLSQATTSWEEGFDGLSCDGVSLLGDLDGLRFLKICLSLLFQGLRRRATQSAKVTEGFLVLRSHISLQEKTYEVDHTAGNIRLDVAGQGGRAVGNGREMVGSGDQAGEVLKQKGPFARVDRRNGAGLRLDDLISHGDWKSFDQFLLSRFTLFPCVGATRSKRANLRQ